MESRTVRVGVDIGGTFTDVVLSDSRGRLYEGKVSSTPQSPSDAVVTGIRHLLTVTGVKSDDVAEVVHGTTVGSNALLQRSGAATGLLTTRGFRDVLEIGRIRTPEMFNLAWEKPEPLVARHHRLEVHERVAADGTVIRPIEPNEVLSAGRRLVEEGIKSVAVCLINSYVNPAHEIQARDVLLANFPQLAVCASCDVLPEMKEYERTSTTVVNAYLLPEMQSYLRRLSNELRDIGIDAPIQVMTSNGGIIGVRAASRQPVFAVASGPAGGVAGAVAMGALIDHTDVIVYDMGGTTAKAAVIDRGAPVITTEYEFREGISSPSRFIKGGGYMLKVPAIDIGEVGAGGGSTAYLDDGGLLHVGPRSVGSEPGPACYGRGNEQPTITDANVILGLLNANAIAGGSLQIHREKAEESVGRHIAEPLGLSVLEAAHGIRDLANATMARALRSVTVERGRDPRDMAMMAFGGCGPMHAADVARILGIRRVIAPVLSGVFSSLGMLCANAAYNFVRTMLQPLNDVPAPLVRNTVAELGVYGQEALRDEGYVDGAHDFRFSVDLRYLGQSSELTMPLEDIDDLGSERFREGLYKLFQAEYQAAYGYSDDEPVEIVNIRLSAQGRGDQLDLRNVTVHDAAQKRDAEVDSTMRTVSFDVQSHTQAVPVCSRRDLDEARRPGPLIVESYDTTIVVPPGAVAWSDALNNVLIDL